MSFIMELWQSVLTPGHTPILVKATHASFILLLVTLVCLLVATRSWHVFFLIIIAGCLWVSITWFINEIDTIKQEQQNKQS
ncbi:Pkr1-domain-containing protein, partial [Nadsonia fulvescens var. elongata DSM 6958]